MDDIQRVVRDVMDLRNGDIRNTARDGDPLARTPG